MDNKIELRNLSSLSGHRFYIPDYQRGYRWTQTQVIKLLNDFKKFIDRCDNSEAEIGEFYCLQPIVVKKKEWMEGDEKVCGYEVIDGQQRLTTLFLIFKCLTWEKINDEEKSVCSYHITYQSRNDSKDFLENIENKSQNEASSFVDYYHMMIVYKTIKKWFDDNGKVGSMIGLLFREKIENEKDKAHNVRVIWYEIGDDEKATSIDIFTRLNIGKIPLTNAELIKALLLSSGNFKSIDAEKKLMQFHIAEEWNQIEQKLQDEAFWYFIYNSRNPIKYDTRIEYIFDLMKSKYTSNTEEDKDFYYTFEEFNKEFESASNKAEAVEKIWDDVKVFFGIIESWYANRELFHLIGFLIEAGENILDLLEKSKECSKSEFITLVKDKIKNYLNDVDLDTILYKDKKTKNVLLLFNILTVLQSDRSDIKFSFDRYKTESWDKEHIASQHNQEFPTETAKRVAWLNDMIFYFTGAKGDNKELIEALNKEISALKSKAALNTEEQEIKSIFENLIEVKELSLKDTDADKRDFNSKFNSLYKLVLTHFKDTHIPDEEKDKLSNMALLNASINRSYGDAFFPIKRSIIKENDMTGVFVPIATKNVFMKYYSKKVDNMMYWTQDDAADYLKAIKNTLSYINNDENDDTDAK